MRKRERVENGKQDKLEHSEEEPRVEARNKHSLLVFFWVDFSRACMSCGTMKDLSSGPKLHLNLEWP